MHDDTRAQAAACVNPTALDTLTRDRAALVRYACRITGRREDAEDAVQTASLIALRRPDVSGPKAIGWLLTVIRHESYRRHAAELRATGRDIEVRPARPGVSHPLAVADGDVDGLLDLRAALAACTADERRALAGRMTGYSYGEIAARHGWTYTKTNRCVTEGRAPAARARGVMTGAHDIALATRVRLPDGRVFDGQLAARRQRRIQLGVLHADSDGYVEIAAGRRPPGGGLRMTTRSDPAHYLHGGHCGADGWLDGLLALADHHAARGEEVFVAPAVRCGRGASKAHVAHTRWLWIDVDGRDGLPAVRELLRRKAPQLVTSSGGSGGVHVYWRLRSPLSGDRIERAHERLIYALGWAWRDGRAVPTIADRACKDRSRVMRLAGTVNAKSGAHARIAWADLALAPWSGRKVVRILRRQPLPRKKLSRCPHGRSRPRLL